MSTHTAHETYELEICVDCLFAIANGDTPEDPITAALVNAGIETWSLEGFVLVAGGSDPDDEGSFSSSPCECCGSRLAGHREPATAISRSH